MIRENEKEPTIHRWSEDEKKKRLLCSEDNDNVCEEEDEENNKKTNKHTDQYEFSLHYIFPKKYRTLEDSLQRSSNNPNNEPYITLKKFFNTNPKDITTKQYNLADLYFKILIYIRNNIHSQQEEDPYPKRKISRCNKPFKGYVLNNLESSKGARSSFKDTFVTSGLVKIFGCSIPSLNFSEEKAVFENPKFYVLLVCEFISFPDNENYFFSNNYLLSISEKAIKAYREKDTMILGTPDLNELSLCFFKVSHFPKTFLDDRFRPKPQKYNQATIQGIKNDLYNIKKEIEEELREKPNSLEITNLNYLEFNRAPEDQASIEYFKETSEKFRHARIKIYYPSYLRTIIKGNLFRYKHFPLFAKINLRETFIDPSYSSIENTDDILLSFFRMKQLIEFYNQQSACWQNKDFVSKYYNFGERLLKEQNKHTDRERDTLNQKKEWHHFNLNNIEQPLDYYLIEDLYAFHLFKLEAETIAEQCFLSWNALQKSPLKKWLSKIYKVNGVFTRNALVKPFIIDYFNTERYFLNKKNKFIKRWATTLSPDSDGIIQNKETTSDTGTHDIQSHKVMELFWKYLGKNNELIKYVTTKYKRFPESMNLLAFLDFCEFLKKYPLDTDDLPKLKSESVAKLKKDIDEYFLKAQNCKSSHEKLDEHIMPRQLKRFKAHLGDLPDMEISPLLFLNNYFYTADSIDREAQNFRKKWNEELSDSNYSKHEMYHLQEMFRDDPQRKISYTSIKKNRDKYLRNHEADTRWLEAYYSYRPDPDTGETVAQEFANSNVFPVKLSYYQPQPLHPNRHPAKTLHPAGQPIGDDDQASFTDPEIADNVGKWVIFCSIKKIWNPIL